MSTRTSIEADLDVIDTDAADEPLMDLSTEADEAQPGTEAWEQANAEYLAAAMSWLRLRLQQSVHDATPLPTSHAAPRDVDVPPEATRRWFWRRRQNPPAGPTTEVTEPEIETEPAAPVTTSQVDQAFRAMEAARNVELTPSLPLLSHRFGLSPFEEHVLLLCAGMDLDTSIARLCDRAQGGDGRRYPTFALAMMLFDGASWSAVSPEGPLRFWRLLEISQPAAEPLTTSALRADERIVSFIKGLNYLDDRLVPLLVPFEGPPEAIESLSESQRDVAEIALRYLQQRGASHSPVIQLVGSDQLSRQLVAREAASSAQLNLYRMPAELLPKDTADVVTLSRLWQRESILLPIALFLDIDGADRAGGDDPERQAKALVRQFLDRTSGVFFVSSREVLAQLGPTSIAVDVAKPLPIEQRNAWENAPVELGRDDAALLAAQFDLNLATIGSLSDLVAENAAADDHLREVWDASIRSTRPRLDLLAQRLDPRASWDDIVLPEEARDLLRSVADQVRARSRVYDDWGFRKKMNRGLGITALFAGESGTGKTMAAEVLANELGLNLYRIDLSAVVSKYIGETEKNLRSLFDAAEDGGAILFFDEADALFGKRSEVKDSHDRYANIEVNYLLQRMEEFEGLAILATNLRSALDRAFLRRLRFVITFPFPGVDERAKIWKRMFPPETPVGELDFARLGRLNLTGGSIHNVALNASFAAAQSNSTVDMPHVLEAARAEFRKMEKPVNESDFHWEPTEGRP